MDLQCFKVPKRHSNIVFVPIQIASAPSETIPDFLGEISHFEEKLKVGFKILGLEVKPLEHLFKAITVYPNEPKINLYFTNC